MTDNLEKKLQALYNEINDILPTKIAFDGFSLTVDKSGATVYRSEDFILFSQNKFFQEIEHHYSPKLVIDVGANVGFSTLVFARVFPNADIISVEPNYRLIEIIKKNCKDNNINNVKILQKAVGESGNSHIAFQINNIMSVDSRVAGLTEDYEICRVEQTSIDRIVSDYGCKSNDPVFIKIDTQGFEERVISGAENTLRNFNSYCIMMEFAPFWLEQSGTDPATFLTDLCMNHHVCEMPSKTLFFHQSLEEIQQKILSKNDVDNFLKYVKALRRNDKGWTDLLIFKNSQ